MKCKMCHQEGTIYRGGICLNCTKNLKSESYDIERGRQTNMSKLRMALEVGKFISDQDTVRKIA